jgi:hypothetical protein
MEVHLTPELQAQIDKLVAESGYPVGKPIMQSISQ